jgi:DNA-binding transcriptional LysR family regulator
MFHELRYVYQVYQDRSFSKAAQKLYISQPSLSAMVKRAEQRIGGQIFDRSLSPIGVTPIGREYIRTAERIMEMEENFSQFMSDETHCLTGIIAIGGTTLFTSYILPPLLSKFSSLYPGVELRVHETHTVKLLRELSDGELDLVADNGDFDPMLYTRVPFRKERLLLMVPADSPQNDDVRASRLTAGDICANRHLRSVVPAVSLASFEEQPFLLLKEGNDTRARADQLCAVAGFRPKIKLLLDQQITSYNLACYGMGAAFISDTLVKHVPPVSNIWFYRLDNELIRRDICFYYRRSRTLTSATLEFMRMVREQSGESA